MVMVGLRLGLGLDDGFPTSNDSYSGSGSGPVDTELMRYLFGRRSMQY